MVYPILTAGLLLGLDSLVVSFAIGLTLGRVYCWLPLAFAVCDGLASWAGAALGLNLQLLGGMSWLGPAVVAGYGLYVLILARTATRLANNAWIVVVLPVCLSLDNLVASSSFPFAVTPSVAVVLGGLSGVMALAGLAVGAAVAGRAGRRAGWLGGAALLGVAALMVGRDVL